MSRACLQNPFTIVSEKTKRIRIQLGDPLTGKVLEDIQNGITKQLLQRPKGMYVTYLDDQDNVVFSNNLESK